MCQVQEIKIYSPYPAEENADWGCAHYMRAYHPLSRRCLITKTTPANFRLFTHTYTRTLVMLDLTYTVDLCLKLHLPAKSVYLCRRCLHAVQKYAPSIATPLYNILQAKYSLKERLQVQEDSEAYSPGFY